MSADPYLYHRVAKKNADFFRQGDAAFSLSPEGHRIAGIASLIYTISETPYLIVLLNCVLHAFSVVILFFILRVWFSLTSSFLGIMPLFFSPYMMFWFSQINKSSFTVFGALLFTYGFVKFLSLEHFLSRRALLSFICIFLGLLSIWLVRPYVNQLLLPSVIIICGASFFHYKKSKLMRFFSLVGLILLITMSAFLGTAGQNSQKTIENYSIGMEACDPIGSCLEGVANAQIYPKYGNTIVETCFEGIANWQDAKFLPHFVNNRLKGLMKQRCAIFTILIWDKNPTVLNSFFDQDWFPEGSLAAIYHIPMDFLRGVLSPAPWHVSLIIGPPFSIFYALSVLESYLMYLGLGGLSLWVLRTRRWSIFTPILCSVSVMTIIAMATPFLGALYRYRYPWWILLACLGLAAVVELINWKLKAASSRALIDAN